MLYAPCSTLLVHLLHNQSRILVAEKLLEKIPEEKKNGSGFSFIGSSKSPTTEPYDQSITLLTKIADNLLDRFEPTKNSHSYSMIVMMPITCVSAASAVAFAFLFFTSRVLTSRPIDPILEFAHPQTKLENPVVILVSSNRFRFGYQYRTKTPNIGRLITNDNIAENCMILVFPTLTFPNHFRDPNTMTLFTCKTISPNGGSESPSGRLTKNGLSSATYFWLGAEVIKGPWNCPKGFFQQHNCSVQFEERVDNYVELF